MMKAACTVLLSLFGILMCACPASAESMKGKIGVGLNYPGISARYFLSDKWAVEVKGQSETGAMAAGLRGDYYFKSEPRFALLAGLEADYVTFKGDVSEGTGFAVEPFIGGEYFFAPQLSLQMDLGPALVMIKDKDLTDASVNGLEYVVNFGINYYFK